MECFQLQVGGGGGYAHNSVHTVELASNVCATLLPVYVPH